MGDKDQQGKQDEQVEVEGHIDAPTDDAEERDDDQTPDVEGHKRAMRQAPKKRV